METRAIFIDKDGTLVNDVPYNVDPERIELTSKAVEGLRLFTRLGFRLVVVSNQPGVALGYFDENALGKVWQRLDQLLRPEGVVIDGYYYCPHHRVGAVRKYVQACGCQKPLPGMLLRAASELGIDLADSWMIGDILHDIEAGRRAGCKTVLVDNGNETEWQLSPLRTPDLTVSNLYDAALQIATLEQITAHERRHDMRSAAL